MDEKEYMEYEEDKLEKDRDSFYENGGEYPDYPEPQVKDNFFKLFRDIIKTNDTRKLGNLHNTEIGTLKLATRHYLDVANYNYAENCKIVGDYLSGKAEVIASTSLSRDATLLKTIVTQIKKTTTTRSGASSFEKKGWLFGGRKSEKED
jgi:hypothetical protein